MTKSNSAQALLQDLQKKGYRLTNIRIAMTELLLQSKAPLSAQEVGILLQQRDTVANKTTIYRELTFLKEQGIVEEIQFGDGKVRYEVARHHHHHLVCIRCGKATDVVLDHDFSGQQRRIEKKSGFKILNHSLEFFGLCGDCQTV